MTATAAQPQVANHSVSAANAVSSPRPDDAVYAGAATDWSVMPVRRLLFRIEELIQENKWEDILEICHPVAEKRPDLAAIGQDAALRSKTAFALSHLKRFNEAIAELQICVGLEPENFLYQSALAFNAYNSVWADKNREVRLSAPLRKERVALAHDHFKKAQTLRPDNVTVFYREGMLYKGIENKPPKALPLFLRAVRNWEEASDREKEARHQERKNYVKSLYQAAGIALDMGSPVKALELMEKCVAADERSGHVEAIFKYFGLGKIRFAMNRLPEAQDALNHALNHRREHQPADFIFELSGRVLLAAGDADRALAAIHRLPERRRRPWVRWTESDILVVLGRIDEARKVLSSAAKRDSLSRHKTLLKLAQIELDAGRWDKVAVHARAADGFFRGKWGNSCAHAHFFLGRAALKSGDRNGAAAALDILAKHAPRSQWRADLAAALGATP